jgi:putative membrane protein
MLRLLISWVLSALSLLIVAYLIPGIQVSGFPTALIAALVIGLANSTLGLFLKIVTLPLTVFTLGLFWLMINALMLQLASALVPGFSVQSFFSAFFGAIVLSLVNLVLKFFVFEKPSA